MTTLELSCLTTIQGISHSTTLSERLKNNLDLTHKEKVDLLVFLRTLTDTDFLFNNRFSYPYIN